MTRKSFLSLIIILFLIIGSTLIIDIGLDVIPKVGAVIREVGPGKTYSTIQEGVDAAQPGDTVYVYAGIYNETVTIDITINLTGEDKNLVILDGLGGNPAILINADFVNINAITVKNATNGIYAAYQSNIKIIDTILVNNTNGINVEYSDYCVLNTNEVYNSSDAGIRCVNVTDCIIQGNDLHDNYFKGLLIALDSTRNIISNNRIYDNSYDGIYIEQGPFNNFVANNTVQDNGQSGIRLGKALGKFSHNNTIFNNTSNNNGNCGLTISGGKHNIIENCRLINNTRNIGLYGGANNNTFINNTIYEGLLGVDFTDVNDNFFFNTLVHDHSEYGVCIRSSYGNIFFNCTIHNNSKNFYGDWQSRENRLVNSSLVDPIDYDILLYGKSTLILLNTSYDPNNLSIGVEGTLLTVQWYLHTKVINPDLTPAIGARIRVEDNDNGSSRETYTTWYDGWKRWIVVTEYVESSTGRTYFTPYNVSAWNRTLTAYAVPEPKMEKSEAITLILGEPIFYKKLYKGWNLISIPLLQNDTSPSSVLSSIAGKYNKVEFFNSTDNRWHFYPIGDLTKINSTMGIWIHMKEDAVLSVNGSNPIRVSVALNASGNGWNLIGYPSLYDDHISLQGYYDAVQLFDSIDLIDPWKHNSMRKPSKLNDLDIWRAGYGYWVHAVNNCVIEVGPKKIIGSMMINEDPMVVGRYIIQLISLSGQPELPVIDTELLIFDSSLSQYASQSPLWNKTTLQMGTQGLDMNCTFYDMNGDWRVDGSDLFIAEKGVTGDMFILVNRLTGEIISQVTFP